MADMVEAGVLDLSPWQTHAYPLAGVNDALAAVKERPGGFTNIVIHPQE